MADNNYTIVNSLWVKGSTGFQQNIPQPSQGELRATMEALTDPNNIQWWNEFQNALIQRIGDVVIRSRVWENPLAEFKRGQLRYGSMIEEIAYHLIRAKGYNMEDQTLLKRNPPKTEMVLHQLNRKERFDYTINQEELRQAFTEEYGLNSFINSVLDAPITSDNVSEFNWMKQLFPEFESQYGFYKVKVPDLRELDGPTEADGKQFLKVVRALTGQLRFIETASVFNAANVPSFTLPEDLVLFTTPNVIANIDVEVLAGAFNVSFADVKSRVVYLDELPIEGAVAILADKNWFMCADNLYTNQSFYNPQTLETQYFLHHWEIISASPFMNAILLTVNDPTTEQVVTVDVTGIDLKFAEVYNKDTKAWETPTFAEVGKRTKLTAPVTGSATPEDLAEERGIIIPPGAKFDIVSSDKELKARTYVTQKGHLYVDKDEEATTLTVRVTATYIDPTKKIPQEPITKNLVVPIGEPEAPESRSAKK